MGNELTKAEFENRDGVIALYLQGKKETAISRELGIPRKNVVSYIQGFHIYAQDNALLQERGRQVVHEFDAQQDRILEELWKSIREADDKGDYKTKGTLLKTLHDVQKGRVDTLQKAGMISDAALGDDLAAMEEKHEQLIEILKKVSARCNSCKMEVARELSKITGQPQPVVVMEPDGS